MSALGKFLLRKKKKKIRKKKSLMELFENIIIQKNI